MGYAIDADRIVQKQQVYSACDFDQTTFKNTSQNILDLLNERKLLARKIVARGLSEGDGHEYEVLITGFTYCNTKLKQLLGL
jgi:hypothetical protein